MNIVHDVANGTTVVLARNNFAVSDRGLKIPDSCCISKYLPVCYASANVNIVRCIALLLGDADKFFKQLLSVFVSFFAV